MSCIWRKWTPVTLIVKTGSLNVAVSLFNSFVPDGNFPLGLIPSARLVTDEECHKPSSEQEHEGVRTLLEHQVGNSKG